MVCHSSKSSLYNLIFVMFLALFDKHCLSSCWRQVVSSQIWLIKLNCMYFSSNNSDPLYYCYCWLDRKSWVDCCGCRLSSWCYRSHGIIPMLSLQLLYSWGIYQGRGTSQFFFDNSNVNIKTSCCIDQRKHMIILSRPDSITKTVHLLFIFSWGR